MDVIRLHKLGHTPQPFHLNPDLVLTVEAHPDTVVTLTTGTRYLVMETPDQVADAVRNWRASVLDAMSRTPRRHGNGSALSLVRGAAGDGAVASIHAEAARLDTESPEPGPAVMKFGTAIGILVSMFGLAAGAFMEGTNPMVIINVPAMLIVLVGTLGATIAACGMATAIKIPKLYMKAVMPDEHDLAGRVQALVGYAEKARRDGLLALDAAVKEVEDPFMRKGLQMVVDGTDPDLVAAVLDAENEAMRKRHAAGRSPFMQAGALAPTMAIVGTVFGLVNVMNNLNTPSKLGHLIAGALLATLIGVGSANVVFLPVANRLKELSEAEMHFRELTLEGILSIQAGDNPRFVAEKLMAYVAPKERPSDDGASGGGAGSAEAKQAA